VSDLAALVLAAGAGTRLRPLTLLRPKALCPVGNVPLLDRVLATLPCRGPDDVAVNAHHLAEQIVAHVGARAHLSVEQPRALGTAGAVGALRDWVAGRGLLVANADAYTSGVDVEAFVSTWDGERPQVLVVPAGERRVDFGGRWRFAGMSLLPWTATSRLAPEPAGLYEAVWREAEAAGRLGVVPTGAFFVDCGSPADYLRANLHASGGESVVGAGARVEGELVRSVVWPGGVVRRGERLVEAIRVGEDLTVDASLAG
jgi:NDP-sugar pyrophosphorylase family protein